MDTTPGAAAPLPLDPHDAILLENDVVGVRLWGPPGRPTLTIGRSDIWDRRWFGDRQPLVTLDRICELAMADRLAEIAASANRTIYGVYNRYDFPCPKPGAQVILLAPFAARATVERDEAGAARLVLDGDGTRLVARVWVALRRELVAIECEAEGLGPGDFAVRVYRHHDTILPGEPTDPTVGGERSPRDFDRLPAPRACPMAGQAWGVAQEFPGEPTFPDGFRVVVACAAPGLDLAIENRQDEHGLGTPYWAEKEGRLDHGTVKRYTPINEAPGASATARFAALPPTFAVLAAIATTQDDSDPEHAAARTLDDATRLGMDGLRREQADALARARRRGARATVGEVAIAAPEVVLPRLRRPGGWYGDVALCSVGATKFCFQDAALWHADFHLNEIRAEPMLTLGRFEELLSYCEMIRTLLPQAEENARDVYSLPGAMYPLVHFPLRCRGIAHTNLTWEQDLGLDGLVAKPLWLYWRYTGDRAFLRDVAWPVLRAGARFCGAYCRRDVRPYLGDAANDGYLHVVPTVSPEHWGLTPRFERNRDCTSAITLVRYLLRAAADAADILGEDSREATDWRDVTAHLVPYPTFETPDGPIWTDVAGAPPIEYNIAVPLSPIFWGDDVGLDSPPDVRAIAERTLAHIDVWVPHRGYLDGYVRPRLGIWRPGMHVGPENLLLSYQSIRIFPAVPPEGEIAMEDFAAEGAFRVSARRTAEGGICDVRVASIRGNRCVVANPWPGRALDVRDDAGDGVARPDAGATHVAFPTRPGATYRLAPR